MIILLYILRLFWAIIPFTQYFFDTFTNMYSEIISQVLIISFIWKEEKVTE